MTKRAGIRHKAGNDFDLESRALAAFGEWKEFMQGALLETSATDEHRFVAGYARGVTDGFRQCLKEIEERLDDQTIRDQAQGRQSHRFRRL